MNIRFVFVVLACLALTCRISYADKPAPDGQRDRSDEHIAGKEKGPRRKDRASLRVSRLPNGQGHSKPFNALNPRQNLERSSPDAKSAPIQNATAGHSIPVRPVPGLSRPAAPLPTNLHRRSTNPAVITGSAHVPNRNTGKIDGAEVHRRP